MRLQKYLAGCGVASRRKSEELIEAGRVTVNGSIVTQMGVTVEPGDLVEVDGRQVQPEAKKWYILYYKPVGQVTTLSDPQGRPTVMDAFKDISERIYPVGRLDFDTEGLLLMTNDGEWMQTLAHPSHETEKVYVARVRGVPSAQAIEALRKGVWLDGQRTAPAKVRLLNSNAAGADVELTIHEGRNRQVRRMLEAVDHVVLDLCRVRVGKLTLGGLRAGQWRELTMQEVAALGVAGERGGANPLKRV